MVNLCRFSHALGQPSEGAHAWRLGAPKGSRNGLAVVDLAATAGVAVLLTLAMKCPLYMALVIFAILWLVAILLHKLFCVPTALNRLLFGASAAPSPR